MDVFQHISAEQTKKRLDKGDINVVDIRDEASFEQGRIPGAFHLTNGSLTNFMQDNAFETPIVVYCYHGISSQQAAQYLLHQGVEEVYSMDGGFEAWKSEYSVESGEN